MLLFVKLSETSLRTTDSPNLQICGYKSEGLQDVGFVKLNVVSLRTAIQQLKTCRKLVYSVIDHEDTEIY